MKRRKPARKPWTKVQTRELFNNVGISGVAWFMRNCGGRSVAAIYQKLSRDCGPGGLTRGAYPIHRLEKISGYAESQIRRAGKALNHKWKRLGPRGAHLITEEQMDEITTWLGHDYWSKAHKIYCCSWCTTEQHRHKALGLCVRCYPKYCRMCAQLKMPTALSVQSDRLNLLSNKLANVESSILYGVTTRLNSGVALELEQLRWLSNLNSGR